MLENTLISVNNIEKRFGKVVALRGVSLNIKEGEVFGLLGANGAGKTTLMRIILGLLKANAGHIDFKGKTLDEVTIRDDFGFLPESFLPPPNLKAREFLIAISLQAKKSADVNKIIETVGLTAHAGKYIKNFSRGMVQRLGLACALVKNPKVLILDEPTLGLDPLGQSAILKIISDLKQEGRTVFFSSHILSQMERLCTHIGLIHGGRVVFHGTCDELKHKHGVAYLEDAFMKEIAPIDRGLSR